MNSTAAIILTVVIGFAVTVLLGLVMIPLLKKLGLTQYILTDIGPAWHRKKQGTPTAFGLALAMGVIITVVISAVICKLTGSSIFPASDLTAMRSKEIMKLAGGLILAVTLGAIGFADDYTKVVKRRNLGLTEIQKTIPQVLIAAAYLFCNYKVSGTEMYVPFAGSVDLKFFYWIFGICVIYGAVNAVNFTDGVDGLCGSVTLTAALAFTVTAILYKVTSVGILGAAVIGVCAGYLIYNRHPAKVMMGDTGSMFLGGLIVALAYAIDMPIILIFFGFIYVVEALSDIIQIFSVKLRNEKVFLMAPIHHHCEQLGWSENKIVTVFTIVNLIVSAFGVLIIWFGDSRVM